jgi:hypothetical protein
MKEHIRNKLKAISSGFTNEPLKYEIKNPPNVGYLLIDVPQPLIDILNQERNKIQLNFNKGVTYKKNLAGHIKKEYEIIDSKKSLDDFVVIAANEYSKVYKSVPVNLRPMNAWINFQEKYEYNPIHNHNGKLSFVIWLDIPYTFDEENQQELSKDATEHTVGCFQFVYSSILGQISTELLPVDKSYNGKMIIFPAEFIHCVYPFYTSDEYRVSISGNLG